MLTVVKKRREYMLQVEFDALTNSGWWRIFAKVEFVGVVSNIVYKVGYSWTCSCIVFR